MHESSAGCDDLDSDGDDPRNPDNCEDRYPPEIVVRNAELFRCNDDDTSQLCYNQRVFGSENQVRNFLQFHFPATDDCSPTTKLDVEIEHHSGSCRDTIYRLSPLQDLPLCNGITGVGPFDMGFVNPLYGSTKTVIVQLDDKDPVVQCRFLRLDSNGYGIRVIEGNTLYHYMTKTERDGLRLINTGFSYSVDVSASLILPHGHPSKLLTFVITHSSTG